MSDAKAIRTALMIARGHVDRNPTDAQKEAGNYRKSHFVFHGLPVTMENPKGSIRRGVSKSGHSWHVKMPYDYGYIKRTEGADGDHVDVCIGPDVNSDAVFIVDQKNADNGKFDEHKVMLGYPDLESAKAAYVSGFSDGRGKNRMGPIVRMTMDEFKKWLKTDGTYSSVGSQDKINRALEIASSARRRAP